MILRHLRALVPSPDLHSAPDTDWARVPDHPDILMSEDYMPEVFPACPSGLDNAKGKVSDIKERGGLREKSAVILCAGAPVPDAPFVTLRPIKRLSDLLDFRAHSTATITDKSLRDLKEKKKTCEKTRAIFNKKAENVSKEKRRVILHTEKQLKETINDIESSLQALEAEWQSGEWPGQSAMKD